MTIKFNEVLLTGSPWLPISGVWTDLGTEILHDPPPGANLNFNFDINACSLTDGALEADIRIAPGGDNSGRLVFRHSQRGCYYAGIGGYARHFSIVRYVDPAFGVTGSVPLAKIGAATDVQFNIPYKVRVEFVGPRIVLKVSDVKVLEATDEFFTEGQIGCETFGNTTVRFSNLRAFECPPVSRLVDVLEAFPYLLKRD
jgi:hypothetical protein